MHRPELHNLDFSSCVEFVAEYLGTVSEKHLASLSSILTHLSFAAVVWVDRCVLKCLPGPAKFTDLVLRSSGCVSSRTPGTSWSTLMGWMDVWVFCHLLCVSGFHHSMLFVCAEVMWLVFCLLCLFFFFVFHIDVVLPMYRVEESHAEMAGTGRKLLHMLRKLRSWGWRGVKTRCSL